MPVKYVQKLVCADATHRRNSYDFQLVTVLVTNNYDEGIPVAWLLATKNWQTSFGFFFLQASGRDVGTPKQKSL